MRVAPAVFTFVSLFAVSTSPISASTVPALTVNGAAGRHNIDPNIYGIASYGLDATFAREIQVPQVRWGGDGTSRYNWQVDSTNPGFDWFFTGGSGVARPTPSGSADTMIRTFKAAGAQSLITIPILPYVNKSAAYNCSFPVSQYGPQQWVNPYIFPNGDLCGNSLTLLGDQLTDTNIYSNHVDNSTALQMGWVQHLSNTFGAAGQGGVAYYQLDNEPGGWNNTHRDVQPQAASYGTISALGAKYAAAIKAVNPGALVLGPSDFTLGGWIGDTSSQGGLFAGQYYLQQMAASGALQHRRLLDYFDEHYYPQFSTTAQQLASTRTLWDPTYNGGTWVEQYEFNGPMQLIPRFKTWITKYYPGTKLAFSEYSIDSGKKSIVDALAEADMLGIFGREGVDFANMWNAPASTDPIAFAFRLFRNYDGAGGQFGSTGVQATSTDQGRLAIYAAERSADGTLTLLVLNKTGGALTTKVALSGYTTGSTAQVYQYSNRNLKKLVEQAAVAVQSGSISYQFPAYSATVLAVHATLQQVVRSGK